MNQRARGFLLGATAGRTTLAGEGLQHQDGSSHLVASTIPNCKAWDPAFAGELAVIVQHGMQEMLQDQHDVFYYITLMNENYPQLDLPDGVEKDLLKGAYQLKEYTNKKAKEHVTLMGSGAILTEAIKAAEILFNKGYSVDVISVTSWSQLARNGHDAKDGVLPWVTQLLSKNKGAVIAVSDYVRAVPESIRAFVPKDRNFKTLGTDGFGRSDTRATLREWFGVDAGSIVGVV